jgi:hypothetical protein
MPGRGVLKVIDMDSASVDNCSWLWLPPSETVEIAPPVSPRKQRLPLDKLPWKDFERLCARLASRDGDVEHCQLYGKGGQAQDGIDIYVRLRSSARYATWQCKRYEKFNTGNVKDAVDKFFSGAWADKTETFYLCVTADLEERELADAIEKEADRLRAKAIVFVPLDINKLSERLKAHPDLVDDFFSREWVRVFCGEEAATQLQAVRRLGPEDVRRLHSLLRQYYAQHFASVDPGLPALTAPSVGAPRPLPLEQRYIVPDVIESTLVTKPDSAPIPQPLTGHFGDSAISPRLKAEQPSEEASTQAEPERVRAVLQEVRRPVIEWITECDLAVIKGEPGVGKSTFLRYIILDLLADNPKHSKLAIRWGTRLPVWVPFAMWTRIVQENEKDCSLPDLLNTWLHKIGAPTELQRLVGQALEDNRLLLLVDGLDEWSNETAARTTIGLLETFVNTGAIPAVATARPLGLARLGSFVGNWRFGELAGLTAEQQTSFAERWFFHDELGQATTEWQPDRDAARRSSETRANLLITELQRDPPLARLASIPLLLSGLIALTVRQVQLPHNRFMAYEELTRLLLEVHPQRRAKAAMERVSQSALTPENRERALSHLAFSVHSAPGSVALEMSNARETLRVFFEQALRKSPPDAVSLAEQAVVIGAEAVGILVEKAKDQIGFLHRTFQEFLSARYLSRLPFVKQREQVKTLCANPQWHDVLLCLLYLTQRPDEVDSLISDIESVDMTVEGMFYRRLLLAEAAFSDLHCLPETASRLAKSAFDDIETHTWMPLRERLLDRALDGLYSDVLRPLVERTLRKWYPCRWHWRSSVFEALADWPKEPETVEVLWRGLEDIEGRTSKAAALALAKVTSGDSEVEMRLIRLLQTPADPDLLASALYALYTGWPKSSQVASLLAQASACFDPRLRAVGLCGKVHRGEQANQDKEALLTLTSDHVSGIWQWKDGVVAAILKGWPKDENVKRSCLESLNNLGERQRSISWDIAASILFCGFPQDDEVATALAALFQRDAFPQFSIDVNSDSLLANFTGHPLLIPAVEEWLEKRGADSFMSYMPTLLCRSEKAKAELFRRQQAQAKWDFWGVKTLLDGWGVDDLEAKPVLEGILADPDTLGPYSLFLPAVVKDRATCRSMLLALLRKNDSFSHLALDGLVQLGCNHKDNEVLDAGLSCGRQSPDSTVPDLIYGFAGDSRVREIALHELERRDGAINAVARAYGGDREMRLSVIGVLSTLPARLRLKITERLSLWSAADDFSRTLLSEYDDDVDSEVKTVASIGFYKAMVDRRDDVSEAVVRLNADLGARGMDHTERRQAAFAGLVALGALDTAKECEEFRGNYSTILWHRSLTGTNMAFVRQLARNWQQVKGVLGARILGTVESGGSSLLEEMVVQATDRSFIQELIDHVTAARMKKKFQLGPRVLHLLARERSGSEFLRGICVEIVSGMAFGNWHDTAEIVAAAEILGQQFTNDDELRVHFEKLITQGQNLTGPVISLCLGWPKSGALDEVSKRKEVEKHLLFPAQVHLACRNLSAERLNTSLRIVLGRTTGQNIWDFWPNCIPPLVRRYSSDAEARRLALDCLEANPTATEKATFARLLSRTPVDLTRLRRWCSNDLHAQFCGFR